MIFNGHTHETIAVLDDVTMARMQTMYADGVLGNHGLITLLGQLTTGVFNYMRASNASEYKVAKIIGQAYDYIYPPMTEEQRKASLNESLLTFMSQAPEFKQERFKNG